MAILGIEGRVLCMLGKHCTASREPLSCLASRQPEQVVFVFVFLGHSWVDEWQGQRQKGWRPNVASEGSKLSSIDARVPALAS